MTTAQHTQHDAPPAGIHPIYHQALAPRVLIVARDERFRRWARRQLRETGFEILVANDGFDAAQVIDGDPPQLIVVDHAVPWFGVICLLSRLWGNGVMAMIPVLLVASWATAALVETCRALGITVVVRRPGEPKAMLHVHMPQPQTTQRSVRARLCDPSCERSP